MLLPEDLFEVWLFCYCCHLIPWVSGGVMDSGEARFAYFLLCYDRPLIETIEGDTYLARHAVVDIHTHKD